MGLLMAGALAGLGKGMSESGEMGFKYFADKEKQESDQAFQTKRDTVEFDRKLEAVRQTVTIQHDLTQQYGQAAMTDAQKAIQQAGGDFVKAQQLTTNPDALKVIDGMQGAANDQRKTDSSIETDKAQRTASYASAEKSRADAKHKDEGTFKTETSELVTAFGTPAVDRNGKTIVDPMSGRQVMNRNIPAEQAYRSWAIKNGITDDNKGLALYPPLRGEQLPGQPKPSPAGAVKRDLSKYE